MSTPNFLFQGLARPPLRACRPQNICEPCFNYWLRRSVVVPTDLPPANIYCPAVIDSKVGLSFPCLKVDDLMDIEVEEVKSDDFSLDLVMIDPYPVSLRTKGRWGNPFSESRPSG